MNKIKKISVIFTKFIFNYHKKYSEIKECLFYLNLVGFHSLKLYLIWLFQD